MEYAIIAGFLVLFCLFLLGFFKVFQLIGTLKKSIEPKEVKEVEHKTDIVKIAETPSRVTSAQSTQATINPNSLNKANSVNQGNNQSVIMKNGQTMFINLDPNSSHTDIDFTIKM
jgi:uncharacterized protein YpmB